MSAITRRDHPASCSVNSTNHFDTNTQTFGTPTMIIYRLWRRKRRGRKFPNTAGIQQLFLIWLCWIEPSSAAANWSMLLSCCLLIRFNTSLQDTYSRVRACAFMCRLSAEPFSHQDVHKVVHIKRDVCWGKTTEEVHGRVDGKQYQLISGAAPS